MKLTKEACIVLLQNKWKEMGSYPKKTDFSEEEVSIIKSYFGPWPRALDAAGVKTARENKKAEQRRQKRIEIKRTRNVRRKEEKKDRAEKKGKVEE